VKILQHDQLKETLYYEQLDNGLQVYLLPKPGFQKTYATFTTKYGSIDNTFQRDGQEKRRVPDGIAHFLEHKMFEQESGEDVFQQFARQGAAANAFTSFTRTAYLFSCTDQTKENLLTLINFVQEPYFTDQNVEKEKGIIGQEIKMYDDNPDWRSYFGLIEALYQQHPVKIDIAGTIESISKITKETLYDCYHTFYHPSNMLLFVVGAIDPQETMEMIRSNQAAKTFDPPVQIKKFYPEEPNTVAEARKVMKLSVQRPKCLMGYKEKNTEVNRTGIALLKQELATEICLDAMFSTSSDFYQSLYDDGIIDDTFGFDYSLDAGYGFTMFGGDTHQPEELIARVQAEITRRREIGISQEEFKRIQKKKLGSNLRSFNSLEWIANQFTSYRFQNASLFDIIPTLEQLTLDDVNQRLHIHFQPEQFAVSLVVPK
jgi:predicted Zn-dependent peptidase